MKNVSLFCKEGKSDKIYVLSIEPKGGGFVVPFQFGPRGGTLQAGCKTPQPVPLAQAEKIYEKVLREKKSKGYTVGEDASAYSQVEGAVDSGIRLMLLTDASGDEELLRRLIADDNWGAEPKLNGKRIALRISGGNVAGVNRRGLFCPVPVEVEKAMKGLPPCVLDGELVGTVYHAFDLLEDAAADRRISWMRARHALALEVVRAAGSDRVRIVDLALGEKPKRRLVEEQKSGRKEGVVFKRIDGAYEPGRIGNLKKALAVKVKFYAEADLLVRGWNGDRQSIEVAAKEGEPVGRVTVPAKYVKEIKVGGIVRVAYLYATKGNQLYQPKLDPADDGEVMRGGDFPREDVASIADLKHEGTEEE